MVEPRFTYNQVCLIKVSILTIQTGRMNPVVFMTAMFGLWSRVCSTLLSAPPNLVWKNSINREGFPGRWEHRQGFVIFSSRYFDLGREWQFGEGRSWLCTWGCIMGLASQAQEEVVMASWAGSIPGDEEQVICSLAQLTEAQGSKVSRMFSIELWLLKNIY